MSAADTFIGLVVNVLVLFWSIFVVIDLNTFNLHSYLSGGISSSFTGVGGWLS